MFPAVRKQVAHGPLVASVESSATLAVQVEGILIQPTTIHNTKGYIHLKGDMYKVKVTR